MGESGRLWAEPEGPQGLLQEPWAELRTGPESQLVTSRQPVLQMV